MGRSNSYESGVFHHRVTENTEEGFKLRKSVVPVKASFITTETPFGRLLSTSSRQAGQAEKGGGKLNWGEHGSCESGVFYH